MKKIILVIMIACLILLVGCTNQYDLSITNSAHQDKYDNETNKTIDEISFDLKNNEKFELECQIYTSYANGTVNEETTQNIGKLIAKQEVHVSVKMEMPYGNTDISVVPDCKKV